MLLAFILYLRFWLCLSSQSMCTAHGCLLPEIWTYNTKNKQLETGCIKIFTTQFSCVCLCLSHIICFGFEESVTKCIGIFRQAALIFFYNVCFSVCAHALYFPQALWVQEALVGQVRCGRVEKNTFPVGQITVLHHCINIGKTI